MVLAINFLFYPFYSFINKKNENMCSKIGDAKKKRKDRV
jgi:hypothetical protein